MQCLNKLKNFEWKQIFKWKNIDANDARKITRFTRSVCDYLTARFPDDKLKLWFAFDRSALKLLLTFYCLNKLTNSNLQLQSCCRTVLSIFLHTRV